MELVGAYSNQAPQSLNLRDLRKVIPEISDRVTSKATMARQKQRRLTTAQLGDLVEDYRSGVPTREMAVKYRVDRDTVNSHVRRLGLPRRYRKSQ